MAERKSFTHSRATGSPSAADLARANAYQRVFKHCNGNRDDVDIVLTDIAAYTGYHSRMSFAGYKKDADAFLLESALANARAEVAQHIFRLVGFSDDELVLLTQAARREAALMASDAERVRGKG